MKNKLLGALAVVAMIGLSGCSVEEGVSDPYEVVDDLKRDVKYYVMHVPKDVCDDENYRRSIVEGTDGGKNYYILSTESYNCPRIDGSCFPGPTRGMPHDDDNEGSYCMVSFDKTTTDTDVSRQLINDITNITDYYLMKYYE